MGNCWESGGPEWLFGATLGFAVFGVACGGVWFLLLALPEARRRRTGILAVVPTPVLQALMVIVSAYSVGLGFYGDPVLTDAGTHVTVAIATSAAIMGGGAILVPSSQRVASLRWSELRAVPWYALLPLPLFSLAGFAIAAASFAAMIYLSHPC